MYTEVKLNHKGLADQSPIVDESRKYARRILSELPEGFYFHNLYHTEYVVRAVEILSTDENVPAREKEILLVAAWFHDTGYSNRYFGHEESSIEIAVPFLRQYDYPEQSIQEVCTCIQATKLGSTASTTTGSIMQDADLFHLGSIDYFKTLSLLRKELEARLGKVMTDKQWYTKNHEFLLYHSYHTSYGKSVLELKKREHIQLNKKFIALSNVSS